MKQIALVATFAALMAAPVLAQKPAEKPAAAPVPAAAAEKKSGQPVATKTAAAPRKASRRNEDARHCLDQSPNARIIKCAEQYL